MTREHDKVEGWTNRDLAVEAAHLIRRAAIGIIPENELRAKLEPIIKEAVRRSRPKPKDTK